MPRTWSRHNWEHSVTGRVWTGTPYDLPWPELPPADGDEADLAGIRAILDDELSLGDVPDWAVAIAERMIRHLPTCGHYAFPAPLLNVCQAIGGEREPGFVIGCYTADAERKRRMAYYVYCLDAWLKDAPAEMAAAELSRRDDLGVDWPAVVARVYAALGVPTQARRLAVKRLIHRERWWLKTHIWCDDHRDRFGLDWYGGDVRGDLAEWGAYGNAPYGDPYLAERELPEVRAWKRRFLECVPDGRPLLERIESTWLCAPKAFRYLERIILEIGSLDAPRPADLGAAILQCEDTYPDAARCAANFRAMMASLEHWLARGPGDGRGPDAAPSAAPAGQRPRCQAEGGDVDGALVHMLGEATPVKRWLVRLFRHKLRLYAQHDNLGRLVGARQDGHNTQ